MEKLYAQVIMMALLLTAITNINADIIKIKGFQTSNLTYMVLKDTSIVNAQSLIFDPTSNGDTAYVLNLSDSNFITKITDLKSSNPKFTKIESEKFKGPTQLIFEPGSNGDVAYVINSKYNTPGDTFVRVDGLKSTPTFYGFSDPKHPRYISITAGWNDGEVVIYGLTSSDSILKKISSLKTASPVFSEIVHLKESYNKFITRGNNGYLSGYHAISKLTGFDTGQVEIKHIFKMSKFSRIFHDFTIDSDSNDDVAYVSYGWRILNNGEIKKIDGLNSSDNIRLVDINTSKYDGIFVLDPNNNDTGYKLDTNWDLMKITGLKSNDTKAELLLNNLYDGRQDCRRSLESFIFDPYSSDVAYVTYGKLLWCP